VLVFGHQDWYSVELDHSLIAQEVSPQLLANKRDGGLAQWTTRLIDDRMWSNVTHIPWDSFECK